MIEIGTIWVRKDALGKRELWVVEQTVPTVQIYRPATDEHIIVESETLRRDWRETGL
jgi:hypothetical protein